MDISPEKSPAVCCTISPASSGALSGKPLLGSERLSPKRLNKVDFDVIVDHEVENLKSQDKDKENGSCVMKRLQMMLTIDEDDFRTVQSLKRKFLWSIQIQATKNTITAKTLEITVDRQLQFSRS